MDESVPPLGELKRLRAFGSQAGNLRKPPQLLRDVDPKAYHQQMREFLAHYKPVTIEEIDKSGVDNYLGVSTLNF
jgi:hypothetical protein